MVNTDSADHLGMPCIHGHTIVANLRVYHNFDFPPPTQQINPSNATVIIPCFFKFNEIKSLEKGKNIIIQMKLCCNNRSQVLVSNLQTTFGLLTLRLLSNDELYLGNHTSQNYLLLFHHNTVIPLV